MKRGDIVIYILLLLSVVLLLAFVWNDGEDPSYTGMRYARITVDGAHYETIELTAGSKEIAIRTDRGLNLIRMQDYAIQIVDADCPDQLCVHMGAIRDIGERVVCLPNRVLVEIVGQSGEGDEIDAIVS